MSKIKNILSGWKNFIDKSEVVEKIAKERAEFCAQCPSSKEGLLLAFVKDKIENVQGHYCAECDCPLSAKIRSQNEKCPLGKW